MDPTQPSTESLEEASAGLASVRANNDQDSPDLKAYTHAKQAIAHEVRLLTEFFRKQGNEQRTDECHKLMVKLAEDRFTLAVVGQFKRGKSSLMNAVVGREVLPTGALPVTSAITILRYGPKEKLVVPIKNSPFADEVPVSSLADYVTEKGNPGNCKKIEAVYLELPLPFLRRGLEFVDTPGVGSAIEANTATTYAFLPKCDAVLFVTSVETPLSSVETSFLRHIRQDVRKVFFVINKVDLLNSQERQEVLEYASQTLQQHMGASDLRLFPVSSRLGLEAKLRGDPEGYVRSGVRALEDALASFLSTEKSDTFLMGVIDKASRLAADGTFEVEAARKGHTDQEGLDAIVRSLAKLRGMIREPGADQILTRESPVLTRTDTTADITTPQVNLVPIDDANLAAALRTRGCPVCNHLVQAAFDFFAKRQYELATDDLAQRAFAAHHGFCPLHTWQLTAISSPRGLSIGLPRLLERISSELSSAAAASDASASPSPVMLQGLERCPVCHLLHSSEEAYTTRLAAFVAGPAGREAYSRSQGLCLRHLGMLVAATPDSDHRRLLLTEASRHLDEMAEDMQSYAMKFDAIRQALHNPDEEDAYLRALIHLVGHRSLCLPPSGEDRI
jgi:GTP-binding protein EngB required for normal cell division